jgi:predicted transcriptional regulator
MGFLLVVFSVMEVKEYVSHFRNLKDNVYCSHRLTFEQVMDNVNRKQLVESILEHPGIHYTLLRKKCNLHSGQFRWHIDVLLDYGIIQKKHLDNHIVFFPTISDQDQKLDVILKFPLRDEIYSIIVSNPGIFSSEIARKLKEPQRRNTVKYHVDKLIQVHYVRFVKNGKKIELYPIKKSKKY